MHKQCSECKDAKETKDFWNNKRSPDGKDTICAACRMAQKRAIEETPQGMYELKGRLLSTIFKPQYIGPYDKTAYQVDHKFSLKMAFRRGVPLRYVANKGNLQLLTTRDNRIKGSKCSIGLSELYATYQADPKLERMAGLLESMNDIEQLRRLQKTVVEKFKQDST